MWSDNTKIDFKTKIRPEKTKYSIHKPTVCYSRVPEKQTK